MPPSQRMKWDSCSNSLPACRCRRRIEVPCECRAQGLKPRPSYLSTPRLSGQESRVGESGYSLAKMANILLLCPDGGPLDNVLARETRRTKLLTVSTGRQAEGFLEIPDEVTLVVEAYLGHHFLHVEVGVLYEILCELQTNRPQVLLRRDPHLRGEDVSQT